MTEFKDMLKYFRQAAGLSQRELAEKIGVKPSTISMYEIGRRQPDFETEEKLCDFFNTDLNTLRGKDPENALTADQQKLLTQYDKLSDENKKLVINLINSLTE